MIVKQPTADFSRLGTELLQLARQAQNTDGRLDQVATRLGYGTEEEALSAVAAKLGLDVVDLSDVDVKPELLQAFPVKLIHRFGIVYLNLSSQQVQCSELRTRCKCQLNVGFEPIIGDGIGIRESRQLIF